MRISDWSSDVCSSDLRFKAEGFRDQQRLLRLGFEKIEAEMSGRHGQAVGVEIGLHRLQLAFVHAGVKGAVAFPMRISGLAERFQRLGERREIAGAVELETGFRTVFLHGPCGPSARK